MRGRRLKMRRVEGLTYSHTRLPWENKQNAENCRVILLDGASLNAPLRALARVWRANGH